MTARECADEQEQGQSRVEMREGDGEPERRAASVTTRWPV